MPPSPSSQAEPRTTASGRAGILALFFLLVAWKGYSLASGNFRIQEAWSGWNYALAFLQDLFVFALFAVAWELLLSKRGRAGLAATIAVAFLLCLFQCVDARMKVRFLHPLSTQWLRYALDEAATIGPDYTVFTGGAYWR